MHIGVEPSGDLLIRRWAYVPTWTELFDGSHLILNSKTKFAVCLHIIMRIHPCCEMSLEYCRHLGNQDEIFPHQNSILITKTKTSLLLMRRLPKQQVRVWYWHFSYSVSTGGLHFLLMITRLKWLTYWAIPVSGQAPHMDHMDRPCENITLRNGPVICKLRLILQSNFISNHSK